MIFVMSATVPIKLSAAALISLALFLTFLNTDAIKQAWQAVINYDNSKLPTDMVTWHIRAGVNKNMIFCKISKFLL